MAAAESAPVTGHQPALLDSPNCEVAYVTVVASGDYYSSRKFRKVTHVIAQINHTTAAFSDEFISAYPDTTEPNRVYILVAGSDTSNIPVTLWIFGEP